MYASSSRGVNPHDRDRPAAYGRDSGEDERPLVGNPDGQMTNRVSDTHSPKGFNSGGAAGSRVSPRTGNSPGLLSTIGSLIRGPGRGSGPAQVGRHVRTGFCFGHGCVGVSPVQVDLAL